MAARLHPSAALTACGMVMAVLLQGCAKPEAPPPPAAPAALPPHAGPPPAAHCELSPFTVQPGGAADVAMSVSSEGGYCAATLATGSGQPYDAGTVPVLPLHGVPRVVKYNGKTSVEYAPQPGYKGHDSFVVRLLQRGKPGYTTLNLSVTVQ